jgi:hypothetical protein
MKMIEQNCDQLGFNSQPDETYLKGRKRFKVIACEIVYRELCHLASQSRNRVDVEFLRKGLHDAGKETMGETIQKAINAVDEKSYDAIVLAYGRCNDGVAGLKAGGIPVVIPRAHDCITFFFGSDKAYQEYFSCHPGTYYRTTGWAERGDYQPDGQGKSILGQLGLDRTYDEYVAKYGKENAEYIMATLGSWQQNYEQITYIDMGLPVDEEYGCLAADEARQKNLKFDRVKGDMRLLRALIEGQWDEREFLVVPPGCEVAGDNDGRILTSVSAAK